MESLPQELISIISDFLSLDDKISLRNTNNFIKDACRLIDIRIPQMNKIFHKMNYLKKRQGKLRRQKNCINSCCTHNDLENVWPWIKYVGNIHITGTYLDIRELRRLHILEKTMACRMGLTYFYKKTDSDHTKFQMWEGFYGCEYSHKFYIPYCLPCLLEYVLPERSDYTEYESKKNGVMSFRCDDFFY